MSLVMSIANNFESLEGARLAEDRPVIKFFRSRLISRVTQSVQSLSASSHLRADSLEMLR